MPPLTPWVTGSSTSPRSVTLGLIFFFIAWLLFNAIMYVPLVQLALGQRKGGALVHFAFGPAEWRMFRAISSLVGFLLLPALTIGLAVNGLVYFGVNGHALPAPAVMGVELLVMAAYLGPGLCRSALCLSAARGVGPGYGPSFAPRLEAFGGQFLAHCCGSDPAPWVRWRLSRLWARSCWKAARHSCRWSEIPPPWRRRSFTS